MSRGHGRRQRAVVDLLAASPHEEGLPLSELRPVLGPDRSDGRRVIRSLLARGDAEWIKHPETGEDRLRLGFWAHIAATMRRERYFDEPDPMEEMREHRHAVEEALYDIRAAEEEKRRARRAVEDLWEEPGRSFERRRSPGPNQNRVIGVLVRYAPDPQMGLPTGAIRRIAREGGDKANVLRAIRSLVRSGILQRSRDGERLRLSGWRTSLLRHHVPFMLDPPLADEKAEAVLEAFGEPGGVSPRGSTPWLAEKFPERG